MSNIKVTLKYFDIMDYEKEADYLSDMHAKGWKFDHVTFPGIYFFTKCQPERVRYQLDYNADGIKNKDEYKQMFEDFGWEYLLDFVGYSYFRKPLEEGMSEEEEDIFCDDDSRLDMVKRIFKGRLVPLIVLFCAFLCPFTILGWLKFDTPDAMPVATFIVLHALVAMYIGIFLRYVIKYRAFRRNMEL